MTIGEAIGWVEHAQTSMQVNGDPYGAKLLGEAVSVLRARLAEVEAQRDVAKNALERIAVFRGVSTNYARLFRTTAREALAKLEEK